MKKRLPAFLTGMLVASLIFSLGISALATTGQVSFGRFGISMFDKNVVAAGDTYAGENGQEVPTVVTYTDAAGGSTNYISMRTIAQLFDVFNIQWDSKNNCVAINASGGTDISTGVAPAHPPLPETPEYGVVCGPFTEVDPSEVAPTTKKGEPYILQPPLRIQGLTGWGWPRYYCDTIRGNYVVVTLTNHGEFNQEVAIRRPYTVGLGAYQRFSETRLAPGETVTRAFRVEDDGRTLTHFLEVAISTESLDLEPGTEETDVTYSVVQY